MVIYLVIKVHTYICETKIIILIVLTYIIYFTLEKQVEISKFDTMKMFQEYSLNKIFP